MDCKNPDDIEQHKGKCFQKDKVQCFKDSTTVAEPHHDMHQNEINDYHNCKGHQFRLHRFQQKTGPQGVTD